MDKIERRVIHSKVELRKTDEGKPVIEGYAAVIGKRTDIGWFTEEIAAGAFDDAMNDDARALFNHDQNYVLGRQSAGTLKLTLDKNGLRDEIFPPDSRADVVESIERGDVDGQSFGFTVKEDKWEWASEGGLDKDHRTILKVGRLYDVGPVTFPAYTDTTVAARSKDAALDEAEKAKAEAKEAEGMDAEMLSQIIDSENID